MKKAYLSLLRIIAATFIVWNLLPIASVFALGQITNRKVTVTNSAGGATGVSYTFTAAALPTSGTIIKSVDLQICDTASGSCTHTGNANGFSASSSTLHAQPSGLGDATGWSVDATSQYDLRVKNTTNSSTPSGSVSIQWDSVTNPTATNATYYLRATTYTGSDFSTGPTDAGTIAASTSQTISLTGTMDESLVFCVGGTITGTCSSTSSGALTFPSSFSSSSPVSKTSQFGASTNGSAGYVITINGSTLTCTTCQGTPPTIAAMGTQSANGSATTSSAGTAQFGLNLRANTTPSVGSDKTGSGSGTYGTNYGTVDNFRFFTGDTVASASGATDFNTFTQSYIVNVPGSQAAGTYSTTLTYICTANF